MPSRSLTSIDAELSEAVKARDSARKTIQQMSDAVIYNTKKIYELLDERVEQPFADTPDSPAELAATIAVIATPVPEAPKPAPPGQAFPGQGRRVR